MKTVLITGGAGSVGRFLRAGLAGKYRVRIADIAPADPLGELEDYVEVDVTDFDGLAAAMEGVDAIVHLGSIPVEDSWDKILPNNIVGTYNLFEAARQKGVQRVLFASSNHAVGFYRRDHVIDHDVTPRPDSRYGLSKVFGEGLASLYADKYGLETYCLRIGNVAEKPADQRRLSIWLSSRDLTQLVEIGLEHEGIHFEIVYGVSGNDRSWYDNSNAERLGYRAQDNAEDYAEEVLAKEPAHEPGDIVHVYQGGTFVKAEIGGDPHRKPPQ
jgi:uronate dehydrogenase